jgi:hypothetical protein
MALGNEYCKKLTHNGSCSTFCPGSAATIPDDPPQLVNKHLLYPNNTKQQLKKGPLFGIIVVSLEQAIAAPFCTRQLADLGARVMKIERTKVGDFARKYDARVNGLSSHFCLDQPVKGKFGARCQGPPRPSHTHATTILRRRPSPEPRPRSKRPTRLVIRGLIEKAPLSDRLQHLRLRAGWTLPRQENIRSPYSKRGRPTLRHRDGYRASKSRHLDCGHLRGQLRILKYPCRLVRA